MINFFYFFILKFYSKIIKLNLLKLSDFLSNSFKIMKTHNYKKYLKKKEKKKLEKLLLQHYMVPFHF